MSKNVITYALREGTGKSVTRKLRNEGKIPAVVYGHGEESFSITIEEEEFRNVIAKLRGKLLITELESKDGSKFNAAIKEIQRHPLTEKFLNVDFQKIHPGEILHVSVPIIVHGTPAGLKMGGILEHVRYEVDVKGPLNKLPLHMELDITNMNVGDAIRVRDLTFQEGVEVQSSPESIIVAVVTPRKEKVIETAAPVEGETPEGVEAESAEDKKEE